MFCTRFPRFTNLKRIINGHSGLLESTIFIRVGFPGEPISNLGLFGFHSDFKKNILIANNGEPDWMLSLIWVCPDCLSHIIRTLQYCKFRHFRENFIVTNIVEIHNCDVKNLRLDMTYGKVMSPFRESFIITKLRLRENSRK